MIKALSWALRQHPDKVTTHEKLVLIGMADMCDEDMNVRVLKYKLARFAGLDVPEITEILRQLTDKGFIKELEEDTDGADTSIAYRLIAS
jgi:hypothetical protein